MARKDSQVVHELRNGNGAGGNKWDQYFTLKSRGNLSWRDASAELLREAIASATEDGAALLVSKTSDGGALTIHVLAGGTTHKLYPATEQELSEALQLIVKITA